MESELTMEPEQEQANASLKPTERWWDHALRRTRSRKVLGGVVGGVAETYGFDAGVGRVVVVLASLVSGVIVVPLYLALWVALPVEPAPPSSCVW